MNDYPFRIQIVYASFLTFLLLWIFMPVAIGWKLIGSLVTVIISGTLFYRQIQYRKWLNTSASNIDFLSEKLSLLPARQRYRLPIFLVTGNCAKDFFPNDLTIVEKNIIVSSEAVWIYVAEYSELSIVFDSLIARWPDMLGRIGVFLSISPEQENKKGLFVAKLQAFRQAWADTCHMAKYRLPVYLSANIGLNNLHYHDHATLPVNWYQIIGDNLFLLDEYRSPIDNWVNDKSINSLERQQRLALRVMLVEYRKWTKTNVLEVLCDSKQTAYKCVPTASAIYPLNNKQIEENLIARQFTEISTLCLPNNINLSESVTVPDRLIKFMPIAYPYSAIRKMMCNIVIISALFFMAALGSSYINNIKLIHKIRNDINNYDLIAMDSYAEKIEALSVLKENRALLNDYFKQGEPVKLGLGLYQGQHMLKPLNDAISRYIPKPLEKVYVTQKEIVIKEPNIIRLDSLSLFNSGESTLKPESSIVLINASMEINKEIEKNNDKGFFILVAGHTDSMGEPNKNQKLSLDRAKAVRDWIIKYSDIPANCFAIQGYGAKKPLVENDTLEKRAKNRRVEISLVPQASSCKF